ncbi:bll4882 [Bradyrhizobium diazoefficiens USDA 110]|jgi:hypothetical protein|uniref:Bll4882 protein n=3 Tax=Bradyrhizobium diazoefficiens TaxID=1355477 RepID=Q89KM3_BRADU|nr:hypothetical protein AAV28_21730 [Bradyrhizobium diazoefficiens USDA 110]APO53008.1 hypothetical protein BD122_22080 [Bradyrhizobium diazoefficiens]KGJ70457.1 hypothetical protein BJA5080_06903 [Bradyrhizobium diazoefficiens SEMIA 5080]MDA9392757.1 hypothetical protein [Bradyrhizobium sp. CCBAU 45394]MDA9538647.1 hypothetical protein [Bradyrhizobium sp. CCBAU 21362]
MVRRMRARLQKFLPLVLLALAMQVLAPIAACWAAGQAVADPLSAAVICHSANEQGGLNDQTGTPTAHGAACALCCLAQANASLDSPPEVALAIPFRHAECVAWHVADASAVSVHKDGSAQARAPPRFS